MKKVILGVTPDRHQERATAIRGSLNRASGSVTILVLVTISLWVGHALGFIPGLFDRTPEPPSYVLGSFARVETPKFGATGFMVDRFRFLTTLNGLAGAGNTVNVWRSGSSSLRNRRRRL